MLYTPGRSVHRQKQQRITALSGRLHSAGIPALVHEQTMLGVLKLDQVDQENLSELGTLSPDLYQFARLCLAEPLASPLHQKAHRAVFFRLLQEVTESEANLVLGLMFKSATPSKPYLFSRMKKIFGRKGWNQEGDGFIQTYLYHEALGPISHLHLGMNLKILNENMMIYLCLPRIDIRCISSLFSTMSTGRVPLARQFHEMLEAPSTLWKIVIDFDWNKLNSTRYADRWNLTSDEVVSAAISDYSDPTTREILLPELNDEELNQFLESTKTDTKTFQDAVWSLLSLPKFPFAQVRNAWAETHVAALIKAFQEAWKEDSEDGEEASGEEAD